MSRKVRKSKNDEYMHPRERANSRSKNEEKSWKSKQITSSSVSKKNTSNP